MKKYFSIISIVIAILIMLLKLQFDVEMYIALGGSEIGDMSPQINSGSSNFFVYYTGTMIVSFLFSLIGNTLHNRYAKTGLIINILALVYSLYPYLLLFF